MAEETNWWIDTVPRPTPPQETRTSAILRRKGFTNGRPGGFKTERDYAEEMNKS